MAFYSDFLPAARLSQPQVLDQARQVGESHALAAVLDTVPGIVALLNPERQIVYCNDACAKAGGLTRKEDALGMRPGELLQCIHATEMPGGCGTSESCRYCGLAGVVVAGRRGQVHSGECLLASRSAGRGIAGEYTVTVRPMQGLGNGWVCCSLTDVASEKRREALERTFFHDIMNRADAVQGLTGLLAAADLASQERARFMAMLSVSARALVEEIRNHRTLLAAEKGGLVVEEAECNSLGLLQDSAATCRAFGFADGKEVVVLPESQSIPFQSDSALLGRILVNMLKNALEASRTGQTVTASCIRHFPDRVRFSVHNDTSMPDAVQAHVFQRSFSTRGSGRGLGTYSIKLLAETYLRGRTWFDSAEGNGTTFYAEFDI